MPHGVLDILVTQVGLEGTGIMSLVGQGFARYFYRRQERRACAHGSRLPALRKPLAFLETECCTSWRSRPAQRQPSAPSFGTTRPPSACLLRRKKQRARR